MLGPLLTLLALLVAVPPPATVVAGTVRLAPGIEIAPTFIANTTDPEVCGSGRTLEDVVVSARRGLANVIVSVRNAPSVRAEPDTLVLDNVECRFEPHAAAITVGSTVRARNSDAVLHTTHLYGPKELNVSLPVQGMTSSRVLDQPGLYAVKCDVHGWMQAFVRVDPHPYHDVTDTEGRFAIDGLPPGTYTLELWHERLGAVEREILVDGATPVSIDIEYPP